LSSDLGGRDNIFPPILASSDYTKLDGNHRYYAHKEAGKPTIWIEKWEVPEALYPVVAQAVNTEEGNIDTPLTVGEKKRAILRDWEILTQYDKKTRKEIIAKVLKTTISYVEYVLSQAGLIKSEKQQLKQRAYELYQQGYSQKQIAEKLGVSDRTIRNWLSEQEEKNYPGKNFPINEPQADPDWSDWSDWNDWEEETEEAQASEKKQNKQKEKKLLHPNQILERDKNNIWDALIEIEFHFGTDKALEVIEEIYFAYKEKTYKDMEIYKDRKALFEYNRR
jgi:transcriptional regulator with XRE-family HTH domain